MSRLEVPISELVSPLCDRYLNLLRTLKTLGLEEVQIHEPALVLGDAANYREYFESIYASLAKVGVPLHLVTYFDDLVDNYNPQQDMILLLTTNAKPEINLLQNLKITPSECDRQVRRRWDEFQPCFR